MYQITKLERYRKTIHNAGGLTAARLTRKEVRTMSNQTKESAEKLAELLEKVPKEQREIVAAQIIGTIQGVALAASMERESA